MMSAPSPLAIVAIAAAVAGKEHLLRAEQEKLVAEVNKPGTMPSRCAGVLATACTQGKRTKPGQRREQVD